MVRSELNRNDKSMEFGKKLYGKIGTGVLLSMILIDKTEKFLAIGGLSKPMGAMRRCASRSRCFAMHTKLS